MTRAIALAVAFLATAVAGCPSRGDDDETTATPAVSPAATAASTGTIASGASPAPSATPPDHVLMIIVDECTGLGSLGACTDAETACTKAVQLLDAAKAPPDDKWRRAVADVLVECEKKAKRAADPPH